MYNKKCLNNINVCFVNMLHYLCKQHLNKHIHKHVLTNKQMMVLKPLIMPFPAIKKMEASILLTQCRTSLLYCWSDGNDLAIKLTASWWIYTRGHGTLQSQTFLLFLLGIKYGKCDLGTACSLFIFISYVIIHMFLRYTL